MADKTNTLLIAGGLGVAAWWYFTQNKTVPVTSSTPVTTSAPVGTPVGTPVIPVGTGAFSNAFYLEYQYPAITSAYPQVLNPNYQLSSIDATNYYNNYLDLQQWWALATTKNKWKTLQATMQYHWSTYGVPQQRSFIPFTPPDNAPFVPPPANAKSSGSGFPLGTAISTAGSIAIALLGVQDATRLNDEELNVLFSASAILKNILPFYWKSDTLAKKISIQLNNVLNDYV